MTPNSPISTEMMQGQTDKVICGHYKVVHHITDNGKFIS